MRVGDQLTETVDIKRAVRQGCVLFLDLFILYRGIVVGEIEGMEGFSIGELNVNNIRYADDTVLVADSVEKL